MGGAPALVEWKGRYAGTLLWRPRAMAGGNGQAPAFDYNLPDGLGWDKLPELYQKFPDVQFHLISAFRPTMPSELDGAKLTIWEKPISLKSLDNFF